MFSGSVSARSSSNNAFSVAYCSFSLLSVFKLMPPLTVCCCGGSGRWCRIQGGSSKCYMCFCFMLTHINMSRLNVMCYYMLAYIVLLYDFYTPARVLY